jgi:CBS domain containing-hemolysin-like protein
MRTGWPHAAMAANVSGTLVLLVFAEYLPKAWFQAHPIPHTLPFARLLAASARALSPLSWVVERMVRVMIGRKTSDQPTTPLLTREDLIHLTTEGRRDGALTPFESRMIQGVFALSGTRCRDIMAPMDRIIRIEADLPASDLITIARAREVNRFPVYDPARRKYIGIVHIFDVLADESAAGKTARDYMRPPQFVAEHMLVDHVLPRMRATRQPLTLVTDAHYEVIGLITLNDVLRVIVGDEP